MHVELDSVIICVCVGGGGGTVTICYYDIP